jgi:hypothetical protein
MDDNTENNGKVVASFAKNNTEAVCVGISEWKGKQLIFVRVFAQALGEDTLVPTKAGVSLAADKYSELLKGVQDLGDVMASDKVVARIKKNNKQEVWIGFNVYKGIPLIYLRTFSSFGDSEELKPTKQGVSIKVEQYSYLLEAVEKLGKELDTQI